MNWFAGSKGYADLLDKLRLSIHSGELRAGVRLPSHRQLASRLKVAVGTVTRAYQEADKAGLTVSYVGRGTFVLPPERAGGSTRVAHDATATIDLTVDLPVETSPPDLTRLLADVRSKPWVDSLHKYGDAVLAERHLAAGAAWVAGFGLAVGTDDLLICSGGQHAIFCALATVCRPGDRVITEELCYPGMLGAARLLGLRVEAAALDPGGLVPSSVERLCKAGPVKALYLTPGLQNPTNAQLGKGRRAQLVALAERYDFALIEDDIRPRSALPAPSPMACDAPDRTLFIASVSKSLGGGFRIAYLAVPPRWRSRALQALWGSVHSISPFTAELVTVLIESGQSERVLRRKEQEALRRRELVERHLGQFNVCTRTGSTTAWMALPEGWSNTAAVTALRDQGVAVASADAFWAGKTPPPDGIRMGLGGPPTPEALAQGLKIIATTLSGSPRTLRA